MWASVLLWGIVEAISALSEWSPWRYANRGAAHGCRNCLTEGCRQHEVVSSGDPVVSDSDSYVKVEGRDLRIDFARGLALWWIFLDHSPENALRYTSLQRFAV